MEALGSAGNTSEILFAIASIVLLALGVFRLDCILFRPHLHHPAPSRPARIRMHNTVEEIGPPEKPGDVS
jgi:hypothetical protein